MAERPSTPTSDAESFDSCYGPPGSPLTREKTRAAHAEWIKELEQSSEFKLLEVLASDSAVNAQDTLEQLLDLTRKKALEEQTGNHCWMTACCFLEVAARTAPEQQSRLIDLLILLRSVTLIHPRTNELLELEDNEGVVWKDLPTFGYTIADEMGSFGKLLPQCCSALGLMRYRRSRMGLYPGRDAEVGKLDSFLRPD